MVINSVCTHCVRSPGPLCENLCVSENGPLREHIVCAKPDVSGRELLCEHLLCEHLLVCAWLQAAM